MSLAIAHFAVGVGIGSLITIVSGLDKTWYSSMIPYLFGVWAMIPDLHHVIPFNPFAEMVYYIHNSMVANLFVLHRTMDLYDVNDTKMFAAVCLLFMFTCLSSMWIRCHSRN